MDEIYGDDRDLCEEGFEIEMAGQAKGRARTFDKNISDEMSSSTIDGR